MAELPNLKKEKNEMPMQDPKARAKMAKAKAAVALPEKFSKAEQKAIEEFEKLFDVG